ncbi:hypothetical protein RvY_13312 [Ramazzottius varieornatus]|uniref:Protein sleepless n=1 Tax=Ramazzottius varieornatus TaxID=947166 RepID=A0A1D1VSS4_RAMVA|nr:hypothetical protein RvY_13312 [Ramazzottius varieornatus]
MERNWIFVMACFGLLFCLVAPGFGLQCYTCDSRGTGCGDPFNKEATGITPATCEPHVLACGKWVSNATRTVVRGCTSQSTGCDYSRDSSGVETYRCGCLTDFCNAASDMYSHATISGLLFALMVVRCLTKL